LIVVAVSTIEALDFAPKMIDIGKSYLLLGTDAWLIDSVTNPIRQRLKSKYDVDIVHIYGDDIKVAQLNDILDTLSIFSTQKLIILKNAEALGKKELAALASYVESPSDAQSLIIVTDKADFRTSGWKAIRNASLFIKCDPPRSSFDLTKWLNVVLAQQNVQMDARARALFLSRTELDYASSFSVLQKIIILLGNRKTITQDDVGQALGTTRVGTMIDFYRALGNRDLPSILSTIERMLSSEWEALQIFFQMNKVFTIIHKILLLRHNHRTPSEIISKHLPELYDSQRKEFVQFSEKYSLHSFPDIYQVLLDTDSSLKLSRATERTLLQLCAMRIMACR